MGDSDGGKCQLVCQGARPRSCLAPGRTAFSLQKLLPEAGSTEVRDLGDGQRRAGAGEARGGKLLRAVQRELALGLVPGCIICQCPGADPRPGPSLCRGLDPTPLWGQEDRTKVADVWTESVPEAATASPRASLL